MSARVAAQLGGSKAQGEAALNAVLESIQAALASGDRVVLTGFGSFGSTDAHTAAGLGARYRVSQKFPVDFSVDVAYNDEDEITTYIYVGQRF